MLIPLAILLLVIYLLGLFAFRITAGLIHVVLLIALVLFVLHFLSHHGP